MAPHDLSIAAHAEYQAALDFLYGRLNYERTDPPDLGANLWKLETMRELLARLGDPHDRLAIVHVAGTKGKGSTCYFLSSILTAAGYRTGCYTSPHLQHVEERFAIDGQSCSRQELIGLVARIRPHVAQMDHEARRRGLNGPTFFEVTTAMAFTYFAQRHVDWVVLEVGLGGRLDSTNVCQPRVCVITTISFDHMRQLGNTLGAIAGEKAGILKPHVPLISAVTQDEPWAVIEQRAASLNCPVRRLGRDFDVVYHGPSWQGRHTLPTMDFVRLEAAQPTVVGADVPLSTWGHHQAINAGVAWAASEELVRQGCVIPEAAVRRGLRLAHCPGRIEVLRDQPVVLLDTAHNVASIEAMVRVIDESFPQRPRGLILAATQAKDVTGMLHRLVTEFDVILCTRYLSNPRTVPQDELRRETRRIATAEGSVVEVDSADSPEQAWEMMKERIPSSGLICVTGSFFLAAEIQPIIERAGNAATGTATPMADSL